MVAPRKTRTWDLSNLLLPLVTRIDNTILVSYTTQPPRLDIWLNVIQFAFLSLAQGLIYLFYIFFVCLPLEFLPVLGM